MVSWLVWTGLSFIIAGLVGIGIALAGVGPAVLIEQIIGYGYAWIFLGIGMIVFGFIRQKIGSKL